MTHETGEVKSKTASKPLQRTYICRNQACRDYNRPRTVTLMHLGQEVYVETGVICGFCEWAMQHYNRKGFRRI